MRNAPSVSYPVGRCAVWAAGLTGLGLLIATAVVLALPGLSPPQVAALGLGVLAWLGLALRQWRRQPRGWLRLTAGGVAVTGEAAWRWRETGAGHEQPVAGVRVAVDLQRLMLVELTAAARAPRWLWLEASRAPADWPALRRAVLASAHP